MGPHPARQTILPLSTRRLEGSWLGCRADPKRRPRLTPLARPPWPARLPREREGRSIADRIAKTVNNARRAADRPGRLGRDRTCVSGPYLGDLRCPIPSCPRGPLPAAVTKGAATRCRSADHKAERV